MLSIPSKIIGNFADRNMAMETLYGHDSDLHFRAQNLLNILLSVLAIFLAFFTFFILSQEKFIDNQTKLIFGPAMFATALVMFLCYKLVEKGRFKFSRNLFLTISTVSVIGAINLTGGFPDAVALPVIVIPIVLYYCLVGGRVSTWLSVLFVTALIALGYIDTFTPLDFPNYASKTNPFVNAVAVYLTTLSIIIVAFVAFDSSVRIFSKRSQAAVESKSQFLANMSHEIRTPMNGVLGLSELLAKTELNPTQEKYVSAIQNSGEALLTIINDILDFSKIEAGKLELDAAPFNLETVINDIGLLLSSKIDEKGLDFIVRYAPDLPRMFEGDDGRVRQILLNLIGNAVKFTQEGSIKVQVLRSATGRTRVEVLDTGVGIADAHIGSIFDKFNQADTATTRTFGGTGLGLAISQRLVEMMGGKIGVTSTLGKGSTFWFEVPLPVVKLSSPTGEDRRSKPARRATDLLDAKMLEPELESDILVVSNAETFLDTYKALLEHTNYSVKYLSFSRRLIEHLNKLAQAKKILPVMVLDADNIAKPAQNFLKKITAHAQFSKMPVIALVNLSDVEWQENAGFIPPVTIWPNTTDEGRILTKIAEHHPSTLVNRLTRTPMPSPQDTITPAIEGPPKRESSSRIQILVAEGDRINMKVIQNILSEDNYDVTYANSGMQAVESCRARVFDIIIMDMAMPVMSGSEAGKAIRQIEAEHGLTQTPIIGLKPPVGSSIQPNYDNAGLTDYLPKPIRKDDLLAYIALYTEHTASNPTSQKSA